jgi:uncharacterized protein with ParB-like and HNH nuclease domain
MGLETGRIYVKEMFGQGKFYRIPEYQRPYVWETRQIHDLLNDIAGALKSGVEREYFIGCMIWNQVRERAGGYDFECLDILDGQQRFITLLLLHAVLRDLSDDKNVISKTRERLSQEEDQYDKIPARDRVYFAIRHDKEFLREFVLSEKGTLRKEELRATARDERHALSIRNMARGLLDLHNWWDEQLAEEGDGRDQYVREYFKFLSNNVLALFLATPDNLDDAYNLFTVLNSRGLQLSAGDILRAQNLRFVQDEDKRREFARAWDEQVDAIRSPYHSFDDLLNDVMLAKVKFTSDKTRTLKIGFDYLIERGDLDRGEEFFRTISTYSKHFQALTDPKTSQIPDEHRVDFENIFFILAKTTGKDFLLPLLHFRSLFGDDGIFEFLIKVDNILSMAWLLGKRTLKQRIFLMIRSMDNHAKVEENKATAVRNFLADPVLDYGYKYKLTDTAMSTAELRTLLDQEPWGSYSGTRLNRSRYLLLKLDLLHGSARTHLSFNEAQSTVEHVVPRKWNEQTGNPDWHDTWVHRLGNLVLLDQKKNSRLSNAGYTTKRARYQSALDARPYTNNLFLRHQEFGPEAVEAQHFRAIGKLIAYYDANSIEGLRNVREG